MSSKDLGTGTTVTRAKEDANERDREQDIPSIWAGLPATAAEHLPRVEGAREIDDIDGVDGVDGIDGVEGVDGVDGIDGVDGVDGIEGGRGRY